MGVIPSTTPATASPVIWHDLECGGYRADLPLWLELAAAQTRGGAPARVLDIGAGTGRVALELARAGHLVTALDISPVLLDALRERAGAAPVQAVAADARDFSLAGTGFDLCLVPMQTIQLLRGSSDRRALLGRAREHLRPGGLIACAIVTGVEAFDTLDGQLGPAPERCRLGGVLYMSRPIRVSFPPGLIRIERERLVMSDAVPAGAPELDVVELERITARQLEEDAAACGLQPEPLRTIAETDEHTGSEVVMLRV